ALVAARGPLAGPEAAAVWTALCEALAAVHNAGLLHRDIKAGNAMRDENGRVLLMDFGLSQDLLGSAGLGGTPGYLAPELRAGQSASVLSDIYAMGVLLRFLVTGSSAPDAKGIQPSPAPPEKIAAIIARATDSDPKLRYVSADQMAAALHSAMSPAAVPKPASLSNGRNLAFLIGAVIILALIFIPRFVHKPDTNSPAAGTPAFAYYRAANDALLRYDKPGNTDKAIAPPGRPGVPSLLLSEKERRSPPWRKSSRSLLYVPRHHWPASRLQTAPTAEPDAS
ncbi:MAG TPA: protein kinase, partial [Terracidiphilus sp.]